MALTSAYGGSAKAKDDLLLTYLDKLDKVILPDEPLGMVFIPDQVSGRNQTALYGVINWFNKELTQGEDGTVPVPNLVEALVQRNTDLEAKGEEPDDLLLVMAFDPASGLDRSIVDEAHAAGIKVVDLTKAGAEILPPDPEPEPPAEAAEEAPWEGEHDGEAQASPGETVAEAIKAGVAAAEAAQAAQTVSAPLAVGGVTATLTFGPEFISALAAAIVAARAAPLGSVYVNITPSPAEGEAPLPSDTAVEHHAEREPGLSAFWYAKDADRDKMYRRARGTGEGKPGEEKVFVTEEGVKTLKTMGLIK